MSILTKIALKKRWITFLVAALVTIASIWGTVTLKTELIPNIDIPLCTVVTVYPGAGPEQVAEDVTVLIEKVIAEATNTKEITSQSLSSISLVVAQYEYGTNMDDVMDKISQALVSLSLPSGTMTPEIMPMSMDIVPVVFASLSGDISTVELRDVASSQIVPRLEAIDGVYSVEVIGGEEQAIVQLDIDKLNQAGISFTQIAALLSNREYDSLTELENTPIGLSPAAQITLQDIGSVTISPASGTAITRTNGQPSIAISVTKDPSANTVDVANSIAAELDKINHELGSNLKLTIVLDQSDYIEQSISELYREAIVGAILAIIVIFVFLMAFRASLITAISIPLSVLIGFLAMRLWGLTVNLLTLSAMAIAVGRVVDDAIVILEVIFRHMKQGESFKEAAINGSAEVATPITSATIATVIVFVPLAFVGGIVGELFRPFALTVTFAMLASLLVALMVLPAMTSFIRPGKKEKEKEKKAEPGDSWYQRAYKPVLKWSLSHRALTLVIAALLVAGSFSLLPYIGTSFLPSTGMNMILVDVEMPTGTDEELLMQKTTEIEQTIDANLDWVAYYSSIGTSSAFGGIETLMGSGNSASIIVTLDPDADLSAQAEKLRQLVEPIAAPGKITVHAGIEESAQAIGIGSNSLTLTVIGDDTSTVDKIATDITNLLSQIDGLTNIKSDTTAVTVQPQIVPDAAAIMKYGLDVSQLQMEMALLMAGTTVGTLHSDGATYDVYIASPLEQISSAEQLAQLRLGTTTTVPLGEIASISFSPEVSRIMRYDQKPAAQITAVITAKDVGSINKEVEDKINSVITLPAGTEIRYGGIYEQMTEGFQSMGIAIIIAIIIAYFVMAITFRSFLNPFIIMFSLPVAAIGALFGLFITGRSLGIPAMMGMLMLVGIVLTNAIVLIALVDQLRRKGMSTHEALIQGGSTRLRPILMTAVATMLALLPLALGLSQGTIIAAELATVVIGGLFTSTLLTLIVVPVVYSLFHNKEHRTVEK